MDKGLPRSVDPAVGGDEVITPFIQEKRDQPEGRKGSKKTGGSIQELSFKTGWGVVGSASRNQLGGRKRKILCFGQMVWGINNNTTD